MGVLVIFHVRFLCGVQLLRIVDVLGSSFATIFAYWMASMVIRWDGG